MAGTHVRTTVIRSRRGGLGLIEVALTVSVIVGLLFVTVRVMNMGPSASASESGVVVAKEQAMPIAADDVAEKAR